MYIIRIMIDTIINDIKNLLAKEYYNCKWEVLTETQKEIINKKVKKHIERYKGVRK